jgi:flagellar hook-associated protein FlgK
MKSRPIGIDTSVPGKMELLLDPYGNSESLASASGGQLGGLQTFINQVLEPAQKSLNFLAKTLVGETNKIQTNGIDGYGQTGNPLFALDPKATNEASGISVALNDAMRVATAAQFRITESQTNSSNTRASVAFIPSPVAVGISNTSLVNNPNPSAGVTIKVDGARVMAPVTTLAAGVKATFYLDDAKPGQQLQVLTRDGRQLLGQTLNETEKFQILKAENGFVPDSTYSDTYLNKSNKDGYRGMDIFYGAMAKVRFAQVFDRNGVAAPPIAKAAQLDTSRITDNVAGNQIPAGAILLNGITLPALDTKLNTPLSPNDVAAWVNGSSQVNVAQASFSGIAAKIGGVAVNLQGLDDTHGLATLAADLQAKLRTADLTDNLSVNVASNGVDLEVHDALGRSLSDVVLTPSTGFSSGGNVTVSNSLTSQTGVQAKVFNDIRVPSQQLDFTKQLNINGYAIASGYKDVASLVSQINIANKTYDSVSKTFVGSGIGVIASIQEGDLVISAVPTGNPININPTASDGNALGLTPTTYNGQVHMEQVVRDLHIFSSNIDFNKKLEINGSTVNLTGITTMQGLADQINSMHKTIVLTQTPLTTKNVSIGVKASIGIYGDLILSTVDANGSDPISIGPSKKADGTFEQNALGLEPIDYTADERLKMQIASDPNKSSIRFSFGTYGDPVKTGSPADLAKAGLRTGAYIEGGSVDDLLVFVTGQGKTSVAASYTGDPLNVRDNLRTQSLVVKFTASDRYTITDASTGTELADRHYDPSVLEPLIDFEGLQLKLSHAPNVGDSFQVDGNHDGLGNNINMLDMVDLAKKPVISGKSLANTYIDQINNVGNLAQQATITQQALTVVHDQSVSARDKVSGVNLDEEAAALIRYQQAYQASAKALQISGTLFDSIVQIR